MTNTEIKCAGKSYTSINRAIKEEMIGGAELMDCLLTCSKLSKILSDKNMPGKQYSNLALSSLIKVRDSMAALILAAQK